MTRDAATASTRTGAPAAPAHSSNEDTRRPQATLWTALGIVYVVWGSTYLAIRIVVETMPPFFSAALRFLTAGLLLAGIIAWRSGPAALKIDRRRLASAVLVGLLLLVGGNGLVVLAETRIPSGLAALLVASVPLWVILLRTSFGDRPRAATFGGVLLGFCGLAVLTLPGSSGGVRLTGILLVLAAALLWSIGSFLSSRLPMPASPFTASAYEMLAGGLGDLLLSLVRHEHVHLGSFSTSSWLALAYLAVFGSLIAFSAFAWLLQNASLSLVATYAYVNPVVAVALGWLILDEPVTWPIALGGAIVVAGVCLVVSTEARTQKAPVPKDEGPTTAQSTV
ncbi:EamA family transporter [Streptacidiphilus jiangxiensis]|uniref:Permease of the drug/metabolite transporter (DMT) superfamily n=1 Tax=Streptacidiphilus jiangxiensis TaxID=235985 RepID=A0A1H7UE80_STRJI|nr:EamA family transporter [Streptacidiphilus jiangxiensis]SEL95313.1 Permease of the drug/metabolite transporter (DMT) superfamily [Streptacidiphilus jiangxiensis]